MELMQEQSRYVVGIDIGTKNVRCVVGYIDAEMVRQKLLASVKRRIAECEREL